VRLVNTEIVNRLKAIVVDIGGASDAMPGRDLLEAHGLDSMQSVQLVMSLEQQFGLTFGADPDDMTALESLEALAGWVEQRV
jgi:acyl carrier protein